MSGTCTKKTTIGSESHKTSMDLMDGQDRHCIHTWHQGVLFNTKCV